MGENGYRRVSTLYTMENMLYEYGKVYKDFAASLQLPWTENEAGIVEQQAEDYIGEV